MGNSRAVCVAVQVLIGAAALRAGWNPETGSYVFQVYSANTYKASPQNWSSIQDDRGLMYFGNTEGLLEFDGVTWRKIELPGTAARSLARDAHGNVYVGGIGEFGVLQADKTGGTRFVSLVQRVPKEFRHFADVWRILPSTHGIYFATFNAIFLLQPDGKMRVFRPKDLFGHAFLFQDRLHVSTKETGLQRLNGSTFEKIEGGERFKDENAVAIIDDALPDRPSALIASPTSLFRITAQGVTPFPTDADAYFRKNALYSMLRIGDVIAAGTRRGGIVLLDSTGKTLRTMTVQEGLPSSWVTTMTLDRQGSVWLTTDGGIIRFSPGLTKFGPANGIQGRVVSIHRLGRDLYVGTTAGLFRLEAEQKDQPRFHQVEGTETTQYTLLTGRDGRDFFSGGLKGLWAVSGTQSKKILDADVIFDASVSPRDANVVYAAGRSGLFRLTRGPGGWQETAKLPSAEGGFRTVVEDKDGRVWATTLHGVFRIDFDQKPPVSERFDAPQGIRTNAYQLNSGIVFATAKGVMRFSAANGRLVLDRRFGQREVSIVKETNSGDTWLTGPGFHSILHETPNGNEWHPAPLIESGIEEIYAMELDPDGTCWAAGADAVLYRWQDSLAGDPNRDFRVLTRRVEAIGGNDALELPIHRLAHSQNALRFEFAAPFFESPGAVEYQVKLDGSDKDWSAWSPEAHKDYTNLFESAYQFHVRARNPHGYQTKESAVAFRVAPPWFRTWWAYGLYLIGLGVAVWGIIRWRVRKLEESNRRLETIVDERTAEVRQQRDQIAAEEKKTESLLLNILPAPVAAELRHTGTVTPMAFDDVTVCFTDFVGFTLSSEKLPAGRLVNALNEYFTSFDEIVGRYGLEKLKTIGDSYMFVSGLPETRPSHAVNAVLAALEMVDVVKRMAARNLDVQWNIRIGLHSGPVVAGVVGVRKFAFDVWGDTVNFAARMESSGVPGRVNISARTCRLLGDLVDCEPRGLVRIKEGRELEMFLVRGPLPASIRKRRFTRCTGKSSAKSCGDTTTAVKRNKSARTARNAM